MTSQKITVVSDMQTDAPNATIPEGCINAAIPEGCINETIPEGCIKIRFSEWEYLPWDNPDNIVSREVPLYTAVIRTDVLVILFLIGCPANVINMAVFFKQSLTDRVNLLLFSLSLADEVCLIGGLVHVADQFYLQFMGEVKLSRYFAFIINSHLIILYSFSQVSFVLSAIIACERCYCVLRPMKYPTLVRTRTMALIIAAVYAVVPGLYFIVTFRYYIACVYDADTGVVTNMFANSEFYLRYKDVVDNLDNFMFGAGLPSVMMMVLVTATTITINTLRQMVAWRTETASSSSSLSAREVALTKMLVGTSVLLIICVFPGCLTRLASLFLPEFNNVRRYQNIYQTCLRISLMFYYINSSLNVFIYYRMGSRYRETFWTLFKRTREQRKIIGM